MNHVDGPGTQSRLRWALAGLLRHSADHRRKEKKKGGRSTQTGPPGPAQGNHKPLNIPITFSLQEYPKPRKKGGGRKKGGKGGGEGGDVHRREHLAEEFSRRLQTVPFPCRRSWRPGRGGEEGEGRRTTRLTTTILTLLESRRGSLESASIVLVLLALPTGRSIAVKKERKKGGKRKKRRKRACRLWTLDSLDCRRFSYPYGSLGRGGGGKRKRGRGGKRSRLLRPLRIGKAPVGGSFFLSPRTRPCGGEGREKRKRGGREDTTSNWAVRGKERDTGRTRNIHRPTFFTSTFRSTHWREGGERRGVEGGKMNREWVASHQLLHI